MTQEGDDDRRSWDVSGLQGGELRREEGGEGEIRERGEQLPFLAARYTPGNPLLAFTSSNS